MAAQLATFIQFCEPTYSRSNHIAELWNTLSSFAYCLPAVYFWILTNRYKAALPDCFPAHIVRRYKLCALAWFVLGLGSAAFHALQTIWAELWDEIGMLVSILGLSVCLFDLHPWTTSKRANWFYGSLGLSVFVALMVYIQIMYHPFFAATFIVSALVPAGLLITLPLNVNRGAIKLYQETVRRSSRAGDAALESVTQTSNSLSPFGSLNMNKATLIGIAFALAGYAIWHVDQLCVAESWKPSAHGWYELDWFYWTHPFWHVATACSSLFFFDAMLKVRVETFKSPLLRKALTGSFVPIFSFGSSVKVFLGMHASKRSS